MCETVDFVHSFVLHCHFLSLKFKLASGGGGLCRAYMPMDTRTIDVLHIPEHLVHFLSLQAKLLTSLNTSPSPS